MFFILKFSISFVVSFLILSIPIGDKTLFQSLSAVTAPYTKQVFKVVTKNTNEVVGVTKEATHKIFHNTKPEMVDQIKEKSSSVSRKVRQEIKEVQEDLSEDYTIEERQMLEQVLKSGGQD